jgi:hypothetical protein
MSHPDSAFRRLVLHLCAAFIYFPEALGLFHRHGLKSIFVLHWIRQPLVQKPHKPVSLPNW